jgi:hypothetical protein
MKQTSDITFIQRSSVPRLEGKIWVVLVFKDGTFASGWIKPSRDIHGRYQLLKDDLNSFLKEKDKGMIQ